MERRRTVKVVLVGGHMSKCGLAARLVGEENVSEEETMIGVCSYTKRVEGARGDFWLNVWDTDEDARYEFTVPMCTHDAHVVLYALNLCSPAGPGDCLHKMNACPAMEGPCCAVVGNRPKDGERVVSREEAQALADRFCMPYFECCVATGEGIDALRDALEAQAIVEGADEADVWRVKKIAWEIDDLVKARERLRAKLKVKVLADERKKACRLLAGQSRVYAGAVSRMLELRLELLHSASGSGVLSGGAD